MAVRAESGEVVVETTSRLRVARPFEQGHVTHAPMQFNRKSIAHIWPVYSIEETIETYHKNLPIPAIAAARDYSPGQLGVRGIKPLSEAAMFDSIKCRKIH